PSHGLEEGDLAALVSDDEGVSWRFAGIAAPHEPGANRMHIASGVDGEGRWKVLSSGLRIVDGKHAGLERVWCSTRDDGSGSWMVNREPRIQEMETRVIPHGRILALDGGRLAATFYLSHGRGNPSRAWIAFSDDGGASWGGARLVAGRDANEVVLLRAAGGALLAATRTHVDHHVALHASDDGGSTWAFRCDPTLPMQHPADLTDLGERGILVTFGIRNRGLMGIGARLSRDGGRTWSAPVVLTQFGEATDCGYPSTVTLTGGELVTACYSDLSAVHRGYHLLALRWRFEEFFEPRPLRSISDGGPLRV
ncbi:MAG: sialidase family protein, partial [Opitutaceae bacterium]